MLVLPFRDNTGEANPFDDRSTFLWSKSGRYTFLMLSGTAVILAGLVLDVRPLRLVPIASHWIVLAGLLTAGLGLVCLGTASVRRNGQSSANDSHPSVWLRLAILGAGTLALLTVLALGVLMKKAKDVPAADFLIHGEARSVAWAG